MPAFFRGLKANVHPLVGWLAAARYKTEKLLNSRILDTPVRLP
jgi:hypothetical protein